MLQVNKVPLENQEDVLEQLLLNEINDAKKIVTTSNKPNLRLTIWLSLLDKYHEILEKKKQKDEKVY